MKPGDDTDEEGSIVYNDLTVSGDLSAATISSDAKDVNGNAISAENVKLVVKSDIAQAVVNEINDTLTKASVTLGADVHKVYYDVSLEDKSGNVVKLTSGSIRLMFSYPEGIDYSKYNFNVYHIKDNGEVENLTTSLTPNGIVVETTGLSPFVVTYELAENASVDTPAGDSADSAQTGDMTNWMLYVLLLLASVSCITIVYKKKKEA